MLAATRPLLFALLLWSGNPASSYYSKLLSNKRQKQQEGSYSHPQTRWSEDSYDDPQKTTPPASKRQDLQVSLTLMNEISSRLAWASAVA